MQHHDIVCGELDTLCVRQIDFDKAEAMVGKFWRPRQRRRCSRTEIGVGGARRPQVGLVDHSRVWVWQARQASVLHDLGVAQGQTFTGLAIRQAAQLDDTGKVRAEINHINVGLGVGDARRLDDTRDLHGRSAPRDHLAPRRQRGRQDRRGAPLECVQIGLGPVKRFAVVDRVGDDRTGRGHPGGVSRREQDVGRGGPKLRAEDTLDGVSTKVFVFVHKDAGVAPAMA